MMKRTLFSSLAFAAVGGLLFSSCTNSTSPGTTVGAPSNVMALSKNDSTVSLKWTRSSDDTGADVITVSGSGISNTVSVPAGTSQASVTGLAEGIQYTFTVASSGSSASPITWMTAVRTMGLQLNEYSASGPSGLVLNGTNGHAQVVSLVGVDPTKLDFFLEDATHDPGVTVPSGLSLEGAQWLDVSGGVTYRNSAIDTAAHYVMGGLDADYSPMSYSAQWARMSTPGFSDSVGNTYDIPDGNFATTGSRVLLVKTQDGNFAKIEIVPAANGQLFSGSGTNKYITVNVSYQPSANQPYADRPMPNTGSRPTVRINAN